MNCVSERVNGKRNERTAPRQTGQRLAGSAADRSLRAHSKQRQRCRQGPISAHLRLLWQIAHSMLSLLASSSSPASRSAGGGLSSFSSVSSVYLILESSTLPDQLKFLCMFTFPRRTSYFLEAAHLCNRLHVMEGIGGTAFLPRPACLCF